MRLRRFALAAVGLTVAAGSQVLAVGTASAHDTSYSLYNSTGFRAGYGGVTNNHTRIYSCDTRSDGYGFRAEYRLRYGQTGYIDDANGSKTGCSGAVVTNVANPIVEFRVIWKVSSGWHYSAWQNA